MTQSEIVERLRSTFPNAIGNWKEMTEGSDYQRRTGSYLEIVNAEQLRDICFYLRDDKQLHFNALLLISSLDNGDGSLSLVYHIESTKGGVVLALKIRLAAEDAHVPSITQVWSHANWHEREAWDMMGIRFDGHPDHRRLLLDEDYPGHPLRKDFKEPDFYHGMRVPNT